MHTGETVKTEILCTGTSLLSKFAAKVLCFLDLDLNDEDVSNSHLLLIIAQGVQLVRT